MSDNLRAFQRFMDGIWDDELPECRIHQAVAVTKVPPIELEQKEPNFRLTAEQQDGILAGIEAGKGMKPMAHELDIPYTTVRNYCRYMGYTGMPRSRVTDEQVLAIRSDSRGASDIAADYGISPAYVKELQSARSRRHVC